MAIIIRHQYNNQQWEAPCQNPGKDLRCHQCFKKNVAIEPPKWSDEICSGHCWEQYLRKKNRWGYAPKGRFFGERAQIGDDVYFVFRQLDTSPQLYTLWAVSKVVSIDETLRRSNDTDENGYSFVYFEPFMPLPEKFWKPNLSSQDLVGEVWGSGNHRYLTVTQASHIRSLIE
ncbi:hypothetical protein [Dehalococcoides mccartyi]|uniref:Uncharacterized protein n=1 Tax=Dehalococcoides mccartyi (strain VS) TaxID=311424 RepID=D2BGF5_DEHMV|nr:hypothetical protein [Dehalococcoides mccartyi]ACZ61405.1 hypothetical protein DhcVS_243 [Dehalococcoides mccartyi VS]